MVHPLGKRPRSWFGPEDWSEGDDPDVETAKRYRAQVAWDEIYYGMSWWKRLCCILAGEVTEPMGIVPELPSQSAVSTHATQHSAPDVQFNEESTMKNQELLHRRGSRLNSFTRALRDACLEQGSVVVKLRNGEMRKVTYMAADANDENFEHPYEDCPDGGFRGADDFHYWQANGESITGDRFDIIEFDPMVRPVGSTTADAA